MFWTDGSVVEDEVCGSSSAGAGFFYWPFWSFFGLSVSWGYIDDGLRENEIVSSCRGYCSVPGPFTVCSAG